MALRAGKNKRIRPIQEEIVRKRRDRDVAVDKARKGTGNEVISKLAT